MSCLPISRVQRPRCHFCGCAVSEFLRHGWNGTNERRRAWCDGDAVDRPCPGDRTRTVREVFDEERGHLLALPVNPYPTEQRVEVRIGKTPYARLDGNDYSLPHTHVRRTAVVLDTLDIVRITVDGEVVATHPRSFGRRVQVEDDAHIKALVGHKRTARDHRAKDRLHHVAPSADALCRAAGERQQHFGALTRRLIRLLDSRGAAALEAAIAAALARDTASLGAVRQLIEQQRHTRGESPPLAVRLRALNVRPHRLADYDLTLPENDDDDDRNNDNGIDNGVE